MLLERFEVEGLSHYSYAVGCEGAGAVVIVDPQRDTEPYLHFAASRGLRIIHVLETHIHADYASGAHELAMRTGATLGVSAYDEGETYTVSFPHTDVHDGDAIAVGNVRIVALHTPGHTPEHLAYLVYDQTRSADTPMAMLSGDFLFVGSLGRPDLLGEDAKDALARLMCRSVRETIETLPDGLEIHPAHGSGSMCGAGMSGRPSSTLGYERIANPYLDPTLTEDAFVERLLEHVPPFPPYYLRMKQLNSRGPEEFDETPGRNAIEAARFRSLIEQGHVAIDLRGQVGFDGAHIPGSLGIGLGPGLATWASWVVPYEKPLLLVAEHPADAEAAVRVLARVGLDDVVGFLAGGIESWRAAGYALEHTTMMPVDEVHSRLAAGTNLRLIDVRGDGEWNEGHAEHARHIMTGVLLERLEEIPDHEGPIAVICNSGYRSAVATSVLKRAGYENVIDVIGGMMAWRQAGLPVVQGEVPVG